MKGKAIIVFIILMMIVTTAPYVQAADMQPLSNTITGIVYDSAGKPVKGAIVTASYGDYNNNRSFHVTTDYKGRYTVTGIESEKLVSINALPPNIDKVNTGSIVKRFVFHSGNLVNNMKLLQVNFKGELKDTSHNLLPGRKLAINRLYPYSTLIPMGHLVTDKNGQFTAGGLISGEQYEILTEDPETGYVQKIFTFTYTGTKMTESLVCLNNFLTLQVIDEKGRTFAEKDYTIELKDQSGNSLFITTWGNGARLSFYENLVPGETYSVHIHMIDTASEYYQEQPYTFIFDRNSSHILRIPLKKKVFQITDTIVDERGKPVTGARVRIIDLKSSDKNKEFISNEDGMVRIDGLEEGSDYRIAVDPPIQGSKVGKFVYIPADSLTYTTEVKKLPNHTLFDVQLSGKIVDSAGKMLDSSYFMLLDKDGKIVSYSTSANESTYQVGHMVEGETYILTPEWMFVEVYLATEEKPTKPRSTRTSEPKRVTFVYHPGMEGPIFVYKP